ncbi:hypothetical protein NBRC116494_00890 [Aurantivibrio plasticivorans]
MKSLHIVLAGVLISSSSFVTAEGTSPWLPIPGQFSSSINYSLQSGDSAYIGDQELDVELITGSGASEFERASTTLSFSYGINDFLALDATIGYGDVEVGNADEDSGLTDTTIGLSWRVTDEYFNPGFPTTTLRLGAIINGDYDGARLAAVGKDANGAEFSILLGKSFTNWFSVSAELGVQERDNDVPTATYYAISTLFYPAPGWSLGLGYSDKTFDSNLDIAGPGFSPDRFQEVAEERSLVKASVGYGFGNHGFALLYNNLVDGRNTVNDDAITLSYTLAF